MPVGPFFPLVQARTSRSLSEKDRHSSSSLSSTSDEKEEAAVFDAVPLSSSSLFFSADQYSVHYGFRETSARKPLLPSQSASVSLSIFVDYTPSHGAPRFSWTLYK